MSDGPSIPARSPDVCGSEPYDTLASDVWQLAPCASCPISPTRCTLMTSWWWRIVSTICRCPATLRQLGPGSGASNLAWDHVEFWPFPGRPLEDVRVLPHPKFSSILADPIFSAVRSTFLAEEEAHNVEKIPHPKFWPFLGRPPWSPS